MGFSRHLVVFCWKSLNLSLIGSLIVFYSQIKHICMPVALKTKNYSLFVALEKKHKILGY